MAWVDRKLKGRWRCWQGSWSQARQPSASQTMPPLLGHSLPVHKQDLLQRAATPVHSGQVACNNCCWADSTMPSLCAAPAGLTC